MKDKKMRQHNYSKKISSLFARAKKLSKEKGIYYVVRISFIKLIFHWPITFLVIGIIQFLNHLEPLYFRGILIIISIIDTMQVIGVKDL